MQLVVKESNTKENDQQIKFFFALFVDRNYMFQVIHSNYTEV